MWQVACRSASKVGVFPGASGLEPKTMTDTQDTLLLAIDGGGTQSRFVIELQGKRFEATDGAANVSTNFEASEAAISDGIRALAAESGLSEDAILGAPAFIGLAGVTGPAMVARLTEALPFRNATYADDRPAALRGALGDRSGVVAHCGTGSFFASRIDGAQRFAGGWGARLGDEASAQWIGRYLLSATLHTVDGFREPSDLTAAVLEKFGDAPAIVRFAGAADPAAFGSLAPMVTEFAAEDDPTAQDLLAAGASHIAESATQLGWRPGLTLCLTGGIGAAYAPYLPSEMQKDLAAAKGSTVDGALAMAREYAAGRT